MILQWSVLILGWIFNIFTVYQNIALGFFILSILLGIAFIIMIVYYDKRQKDIEKHHKDWH